MDTSDHVMNPHVAFGGVNWTAVSHEQQVKMVQDMPTWRPTGPTNPAFSTPPSSPIMATATGSQSCDSSYTGMSTGKSSGLIRSSPYAAAIRAQLQAEAATGKVLNSHLSFGTTRLRELHQLQEEDAHKSAGGSSSMME